MKKSLKSKTDPKMGHSRLLNDFLIGKPSLLITSSIHFFSDEHYFSKNIVFHFLDYSANIIQK